MTIDAGFWISVLAVGAGLSALVWFTPDRQTSTLAPRSEPVDITHRVIVGGSIPPAISAATAEAAERAVNGWPYRGGAR